jgi:hypothetical protein
MQLRNIVGVETRHGLRTFELHHGDLTSPAAKADLLIVSAFASEYAPIPGSLIGALFKRCSISVEDLSLAPEFDLREAFSFWISPELSGRQFKRILGVEIVGSALQPAEVMENVFVGIAILEAKGIRIESVALPLLGGGLQEMEADDVVPPLLGAAKRALERSLCLKRILFIDIDASRVEHLRIAMDAALRRVHVTLPKTELIQSLRADILRALDHTLELFRPAHEALPTELSRILSQVEPRSFEVGLLGRRLAEFITDDLLARPKTSPDLAKKIEQLAEKGVAPWIRGYLHTLRTFGNESAHEKAATGRVPEALSEDDLAVCLFCIRRILAFWTDNRETLSGHAAV